MQTLANPVNDRPLFTQTIIGAIIVAVIAGLITRFAGDAITWFEQKYTPPVAHNSDSTEIHGGLSDNRRATTKRPTLGNEPKLAQGPTLKKQIGNPNATMLVAGEIDGITGINVHQSGAFLQVWSLEGGSPADQAGIRLADKILLCDGYPVANVFELRRHLKGIHAERRVTFTIQREGGGRANLSLILRSLS